MRIRSLLFAPGDSTRKIEKALALGAAVGLSLLTRNDVGAAIAGVAVAAGLRWLGL